MMVSNERQFFVREEQDAIAHGKFGDTIGCEVSFMSGVDEDVLLIIAIHQVTFRENKAITLVRKTRYYATRILHLRDGRMGERFQLHQIELERPICAFRFHGHSTKTDLRETMELRSKTRLKESLCAIT